MGANSLAGFMGAGLEDGRYGVCIADGTQVVFAGGLRRKKKRIKLRSTHLHLVYLNGKC